MSESSHQCCRQSVIHLRFQGLALHKQRRRSIAASALGRTSLRRHSHSLDIKLDAVPKLLRPADCLTNVMASSATDLPNGQEGFSAEAFFATQQPPSNLEETLRDVRTFVARHRADRRKVVLVTVSTAVQSRSKS